MCICTHVYESWRTTFIFGDKVSLYSSSCLENHSVVLYHHIQLERTFKNLLLLSIQLRGSLGFAVLHTPAELAGACSSSLWAFGDCRCMPPHLAFMWFQGLDLRSLGFLLWLVLFFKLPAPTPYPSYVFCLITIFHLSKLLGYLGRNR